MPPPHSAVWFPRLLSCWLSRGSTRHSVHSVVRQPYLDQIGWMRFSKMKPFHMMLLYKPKCLNIFMYFTKGLISRVACTQMHCLMFYVGGNISSVIWLLKSWLFGKIFPVQFLKHTVCVNILLEGRKTLYTERYRSVFR